MNLWAKSLRQLSIAAVALFFFSCEDEPGFLGFKNPRPKFDVAYVEIPLLSSVVLIDSIITDNLGTSGINLIGAYNDPQLGNVRTESYLQMLPASTSKLDASAVYDSTTLQLRLNFYSYGFPGAQNMLFNLHELTTDLYDLADTVNYKRQYYNSSYPYDPASLGEAHILVDYDSLKKNQALTSGQDTFLLKSRMTDAFGTKLFSIAYNDNNSELSDRKKFLSKIKGIVITPTQDNGVLGINPTNSLSKLIVHYHTMENGGVKDTLQKSFVFVDGATYARSFTNVTVNRGGTELATLMQPYQSQAPASGLRVVQSGSPVMTKLDLSGFYAFADTIDKLVINSAQLVIDNVSSPTGSEVHTDLLLKVVNGNDQFMYARVTADREAMLRYYLFNDSRHYYVNSDASSGTPVSLKYNADDDQFSGFMTLFVQSLFSGRKTGDAVNESRLRYLGINPLNPASGTSVTRTTFNANNVKLRIFYTVPANSGANP